MSERVKHMVRYYLPGTFFSEHEYKEIADRSIAAAVAKAPKHAFAFVLYDSPIADFEFDASRFHISPIPQNESAKHYLGGTVYTLDDLRVLKGDYRTLIGNIEGNGWRRAIRCRTGNWQPFEDGDVLVEA